MRLRFILPLLIALLCPTFALGAFTEFYCNASTGSNMNGGSDENTSPSYTATNGGWNSGTGVFTPTSGDPSASGVSVGQFAHVFADGGTTPTFIGRVTAVSSTTVTVSTTAKSGTAPGTSGTGISINVGGCWKGPNGTDDFPLDFVTNAQVNSTGNPPRINLKNNASYSISAAMVPNQLGPIVVQGYSSTVADGGRATFDAGGNAIHLLNPSTTADSWSYIDLIFTNNGSSGSWSGANIASGVICNDFRRCKFHSLSYHGISQSGGTANIVECEITDCNKSNTTSGAGIAVSATGISVIRCYLHDIAGTNSIGIYFSNGSLFCYRTIFDTIGSSSPVYGYGLYWRSGGPLVCLNCDFYNNAASGLREYRDLAPHSTAVIENCNFVKNGAYGLAMDANSFKSFGEIKNCGFGSGTQANTSGETDTNTLIWWEKNNCTTYASNVTPWNDPANGDFTITLAAAKGAGRGAFATGLTSTVGYPDIGAAQHQDSGGGGVSRARVVNPRD